MYRAPIRELRFVLDELLGVGVLSSYPELSDYSSETAESILGEAARFAEEVLEPLNQSGDREGARWTPEGVVTPKGFAEAYRQFVEGGWPQLGADPQYGGQLVPNVLSTAVRDRSAQVVRHAHAKAAVSTEDGKRDLDRHDGSHRAAGRL